VTDHVNFLLLGLGNGAVFAALAVALVVCCRSSGVLNFATGTIALYGAYTYAFLRNGELLNPIPGFPKTIDVGGPMLAHFKSASGDLFLSGGLKFHCDGTAIPLLKNICSSAFQVAVLNGDGSTKSSENIDASDLFTAK